jgi:hypothetical protein
MESFLDGKPETGNTVIENFGKNRQSGFLMQKTAKRVFDDLRCGDESVVAEVFSGEQVIGVNFENMQRKKVAVVLNKVPRVPGELALDIFQKAFRAVEVQVLIPAKEKAKKPVKPDKMIHMSMGNKNVAGL